jgi:RHS repeat-associated protein
MNRSFLNRIFSVFLYFLLVKGAIVSATLLFPDIDMGFADVRASTREYVLGEVAYVGPKDSRFHITKIYHSSSTHELWDVKMVFWRYKEGDSRDSAEKMPLDLTWSPFSPEELPLHWYDLYEKSETGQTFRYYIQSIFTWKPKNPGDVSTAEDEYDILQTVTPGHAWGEILQDTFWDGEVEQAGNITVPEGVKLNIEESASVSGNGQSFMVSGQLLATGAVLDNTRIFMGSGGLVSIKDCTLTDYMRIWFEPEEPPPSELVFQDNSGNATGDIWFTTDLTTPMTISRNNLPGMRLKLESVQRKVQMDENSFESISASDCLSPEGSPFTIENNTVSSISLGNVPGALIRENIVNSVSLKEFNGSGGAIIEGNAFGDYSLIQVKNCHRHNREGIFIRSNEKVTQIYLDDVTGVTVNDNIVNFQDLYFPGIVVTKGSYNIIKNNVIQGPKKNVVEGHLGGILLGHAGDDNDDGTAKVTHNQIFNNLIVNYRFGMGLGSASDNLISRNTLMGNRACLHLGPYDKNIDGLVPQVAGSAHPRDNLFWDNFFFTEKAWPPQVKVRVDVPSEDFKNFWNIEKAVGSNIVGGSYLGGNYWGGWDWNDEDKTYYAFDSVDEDGDGILDSPYVIDTLNQDNLPLAPQLSLQLSEAYHNPSGPGFSIAPDAKKTVTVLHVRLENLNIVDGMENEPLKVTALEFDFIGEFLWPEAEFTVTPVMTRDLESATLYAVASYPGGDREKLGTVYFAGMPETLKTIRFTGLDEVIEPNEFLHYVLEYTIYRTSPNLCVYGAALDPEKVTAVNPETDEAVRTHGTIVTGTMAREGSRFSISSPAGAEVTAAPAFPANLYTRDQTVLLTATAPDGYLFEAFQVHIPSRGDPVTYTDNALSLTIDWLEDEKDVVITALFKEGAPASDENLHGRLPDPVNTATGEFYFELPLFDLGGPLPLSANIYYGSLVSANLEVDRAFGHVLGTNWLHNHQYIRLYKGDTRTEVIYDRGKILRFNSEGTGWVFAAYEGVDYALKADADGNHYLLDPEKNRVYTFNTDRRLIKIQDRKGNSHDLQYDQEGFLTQVTDNLGRNLNYTYTDTRLTGISDGKGRTYILGYTDGSLTSITDPMGRITKFEYAESDPSLIEKMIHPRGNHHYIQGYDAGKRVTSQTDAFGNKTEIGFLPGGGTRIKQPEGAIYEHGHISDKVLNTYRDSTGKTTKVDYDDALRPLQINDRRGEATAITYDEESGLRESVTNPEGAAIHYTYEKQTQQFADRVSFDFHLLTRIDYGDDTFEALSYDGKGNISHYRDRAGYLWLTEVNERGQVVKFTNPAGGESVFGYHEDGTLAHTETTDTGKVSYIYDQYLRPVKAVFPDESETSVALDLLDRIISLTDQAGNKTVYDLDENGNLAKITDPGGKSLTFIYDAMDRVVEKQDSLGRKNRFTYDAMGRLAGVQGPDAGKVAIAYDEAGSLSWFEDQEGKKWHAAYDSEGVPLTRATPMGYETSLQADRAGLITGITSPDGESVQMVYDKAGKVISAVSPGNRKMHFGYDPRGKIDRIRLEGFGSVSARYDSLGNISRITDFNGRHWAYTFTPMGRTRTFTDPLNRTWLYGYDTLGRLQTITRPDESVITHGYDSRGNLITVHNSLDDTARAYDYDTFNRVVRAGDLELAYDSEDQVVEAKRGGMVFTAEHDSRGYPKTLGYDGIFDVQYTYDARGLPVKVTDTLTDTEIEMAYDADGRLISVKRSNGVDSAAAWDGNDRLVAITHGTLASMTFSYDARGLITGVDRSLPLAPDSLLTASGDVFGYDAAGQLSGEEVSYDLLGRRTADGRGNSFRWNGSGKLAGVNDIDFTYDAMGKLVSRKENGSETRYEYLHTLGKIPLAGEMAGKQWRRFYVWSPEGLLLYMIDAADGNKVYFYHTDQAGSTLFLTDAEGSVTDTYAYDPYGLLIGHGGDNDQPFTYMGTMGVRREPALKNFYQMGARFYDATSAAFLSKEPMGLNFTDPVSLSPYYFPRDPMLYGDPTGESWKAIMAGFSWGKGLKDVAKQGVKNIKNAKGGTKKVVKSCKGTAKTSLIAAQNTLEDSEHAGFWFGFAMGMIPGSSEAADLLYKAAVWGDIESITVEDVMDIVGGVLRDMSPWTLVGAVGELLHELLPHTLGEKDGWLKKAAVGTAYAGLAAKLSAEFLGEGIGKTPTRIGNILFDPAGNSRQSGLDQKSRWPIIRASAQFGSWLGQYTAGPINWMSDTFTYEHQPDKEILNKQTHFSWMK